MRRIKYWKSIMTTIVFMPIVTMAGGKCMPDEIAMAPFIETSVEETLDLYIGIGVSEFLIKRDTCDCAPKNPALEDHR